MQENCFTLLHAISEETKDFIVVYKDGTLIFSNHSFNAFFGVSSAEEFTREFRTILDCCVPHPSYFNANKVQEGESWFDAVLALDKIDRVVSFLSQNHTPHAFSVQINQDIADYVVVIFSDITQTLIKRILIDNHMNIDEASGAYAKDYFLHIKQSFEDAAVFNKKHIGLTRVVIESDEDFDVKEITEKLKSITRDDDMVIRWASREFLIAYLVESEEKAKAVHNKLNSLLKTSLPHAIELSSILQQEHEPIMRLINKLKES